MQKVSDDAIQKRVKKNRNQFFEKVRKKSRKDQGQKYARNLAKIWAIKFPKREQKAWQHVKKVSMYQVRKSTKKLRCWARRNIKQKGTTKESM